MCWCTKSHTVRLLIHLSGNIDGNQWGQMTHVCVRKLTTIGSDNGLVPGRRQDIIWTNAGILFIEQTSMKF